MYALACVNAYALRKSLLYERHRYAITFDGY